MKTLMRLLHTPDAPPDSLDWHHPKPTGHNIKHPQAKDENVKDISKYIEKAKRENGN